LLLLVLLLLLVCWLQSQDLWRRLQLLQQPLLLLVVQLLLSVWLCVPHVLHGLWHVGLGKVSTAQGQDSCSKSTPLQHGGAHAVLTKQQHCRAAAAQASTHVRLTVQGTRLPLQGTAKRQICTASKLSSRAVTY
jgi:hypothetical protein